MITSINEIRRRTQRFRKQRLTLTIRKSRLFRDASNTDVSTINGIFIFATRPRGNDLSKIRLHLADTVIDGEPFPFRRRTSRHKKRYLHPISISLTDIVWPAQASSPLDVDGNSKVLPESTKEGDLVCRSTQSARIEKGKAGFLARLLPAPGTPPGDQIGAPLLAGSGQRDTYRMDPAFVQQIFNRVRKAIRQRRQGYGSPIDEIDLKIYNGIRKLLQEGKSFRSVINICCGAVE